VSSRELALRTKGGVSRFTDARYPPAIPALFPTGQRHPVTGADPPAHRTAWFTTQLNAKRNRARAAWQVHQFEHRVRAEQVGQRQWPVPEGSSTQEGDPGAPLHKLVRRLDEDYAMSRLLIGLRFFVLMQKGTHHPTPYRLASIVPAATPNHQPARRLRTGTDRLH
jgi:hypothetical protein